MRIRLTVKSPPTIVLWGNCYCAADLPRLFECVVSALFMLWLCGLTTFGACGSTVQEIPKVPTPETPKQGAPTNPMTLLELCFGTIRHYKQHKCFVI